MSHSNAEQQWLKKSLLLPLLFVGVIWFVKLVELSFGISFSFLGIEPRTLTGLRGVVLSPFLHGDLSHLFSNSFPIIVLGFIILQTYRSIVWQLLFWLTIMSGFWTWTIGRPSYHIGASGVIYGMAFFVFVSGVLRRDTRSMALAMLVTFLYGGFVWGLLPIQEGVSWEGHIAGALAGIFCAIYFRDVNKPEPRVFSEEVDEDDLKIIGEPFWVSKREELPKNVSNSEQNWTVRYHYKPKKSDD